MYGASEYKYFADQCRRGLDGVVVGPLYERGVKRDLLGMWYVGSWYYGSLCCPGASRLDKRR